MNYPGFTAHLDERDTLTIEIERERSEDRDRDRLVIRRNGNPNALVTLFGPPGCFDAMAIEGAVEPMSRPVQMESHEAPSDDLLQAIRATLALRKTEND